MEIDLYRLFVNSPALVIFMAIGFGYLLGNVRIYGFQVGATGGVLISALGFGYLGFEHSPLLETIGFTLFIYSVGLQAGPSFFSVLMDDGRRYILLAIVVVSTGFLTAKGLTYLFHVDNGFAAGLFAGSLTSTPTLVGAQNAVQTSLMQMPEGLSKELITQHISIGYALTYIFGVAGLMALVKLMPAVLKIDLAEEANRIAKQRGYDNYRPLQSSTTLPIIRAYRIEDERLVGQSLDELSKAGRMDRALYKIKRGNQLIDPYGDFELQLGDKLALLASPAQHAAIHKESYKLSEVLDDDLLGHVIDAEEIVITTDVLAGKRISEVERFITIEHRCFISGLSRSHIELPLHANTLLQKGDVLRVTGERSFLEKLAGQIGPLETKVQETDLVTFAFGISAGLVLGQLQLKIGNFELGLGSAGGLLIAGILISFFRSRHPTFGRVPPAARYVIMELGLMLFMVNIGLKAGAGIVDALMSVGSSVILIGIFVTLIPVIVGYTFGFYVLKLNPALLLGSLTGAMTSTPALGVVQKAVNSSVPALGYAGTYTFANVLSMMAGMLMVVL